MHRDMVRTPSSLLIQETSMTCDSTSAAPTRLAARLRERLTTLAVATVAAATLLACGGSNKPKVNRYQASVDAQEQCCEQLGDGGSRDACLARIVRVDDPAVQSSDINQQTYACVQRHFVCDPATGTATQASSQEQLDCISDL
jgi:hypothetical protein